jgi:hypothetical protein
MTALILRTLEELDGAEARLVLLDLPPMDVDRVSLHAAIVTDNQLLQDAANLRVAFPLPGRHEV